MTFEIEMAARKLNGNPDDHRDGFITFNVFDLQSLLAFDLINTGTRTLSAYERLAVPGLVDGEDAFTYVVDPPLCGIQTAPEDYQHCAIALDAAAGSVRFTVAGALIYRVPSLPVIPTQRHVGIGLMTLLPIEDGRSARRVDRAWRPAGATSATGPTDAEPLLPAWPEPCRARS